MSDQRKHSRGFTVVELVLAIAVGIVLLAAVATAIVSGQRSSTGVERKVTTNQDARAALELMASEIRMASFNATFEPNLWRDPANCNTAGNQNRRGIQEATATSITVVISAHGTPARGTPHASKISWATSKRYSLHAAHGEPAPGKRSGSAAASKASSATRCIVT